MTETQQRVLAYVQEFLADHGMPPTRNEIRLAFGWKSANAAEEHLKALARQQVIQLIPGISRGIRLVAA